jgi:hypothetical protein
MFRASAVVLLVAVFSLPVSGGGGPDERAALEAARAALGEAAERLTDVAEHHLREKRIDEAREVIDAIAGLVELERAIADRIASLPVAAGPPLPARPPLPPEPPAAPPPDAPSSAKPPRAPDTLELALDWLAAHQDEGGFWDCDGFMSRDKVAPVCDGAGNALYDPGVTGLALLPFLGSGETHKHGRYKGTVRSGLAYLKQIQDPEGCFGPRVSTHFTYNTAIATLAMCEAYALTASPLYKANAQLGIDFLHACRNPYLAWRYGVRPGDNDTSVSSWMTMALKSAKAGGLRVDQETFDGMKAWLDKVTEPEYGRVGYTARGTGPARLKDVMDLFPSDRSESLTAAGILCRVLCGEDPAKSEMIAKGVVLCRKQLPEWNEQAGSIDMVYWYFGTLAMFQVGGDAWTEWSRAIREVFIPHQRKDPPSFAGSFDPVDAWGREGGRVYATALMALSYMVSNSHRWGMGR